MFSRIRDYHRIKEEREQKKAEEEKLEKLRKEQERDRIAAHTMQTQQLQVLKNTQNFINSPYIVDVFKLYPSIIFNTRIMNFIRYINVLYIRLIIFSEKGRKT